MQIESKYDYVLMDRAGMRVWRGTSDEFDMHRSRHRFVEEYDLFELTDGERKSLWKGVDENGEDAAWILELYGVVILEDEW